MAPLVKEFQLHKDDFKTIVCVTGQHRQLLDPVLAAKALPLAGKIGEGLQDEMPPSQTIPCMTLCPAHVDEIGRASCRERV